MSEQNPLPDYCYADRRSFLKSTAALTAGFTGLLGTLAIPESAAAAPAAAPDDTSVNILGPRPGYSPQIGVFVSELTWLREVNGIIVTTIGALMLHLAATETYYQMNTFDGMKWDSWSDSIKKQWDPAMNLGDAGRKAI